MKVAKENKSGKDEEGRRRALTTVYDFFRVSDNDTHISRVGGELMQHLLYKLQMEEFKKRIRSKRGRSEVT